MLGADMRNVTFFIVMLRHFYVEYRYAECRNAECRFQSVHMLSVIVSIGRLSAVMLSRCTVLISCVLLF